MTAKTDTKPTSQALPADLAAVALIDAPTCAAAGAMSVSWWHDEVRAGRAPAPVIRKPRCTRWRMADVRAFWAKSVEQAAADTQAAAGVKAARAKLRKDGSADVLALLAGEDESAEPVRRRYVVNDLTYEKLGEILAANPDGVLSVRDEMRGLFMSLAREKAAPARAFYLQAWSGGRYTFDRIGRGTVTVDDARLSIIGGIQPGPLSELVQQARRGAADDGMIERFLIAWPDAPGEWREVDRWPDTGGKRRAWETFERLDTLTAGALAAERESDIHGEPRGLPFVRFDDEAREAFGEWRSDFERTIRAAEGEGLVS